MSPAASAMPNVQGQYASVNGLNLYYEIHGQGKPLVLIHGGGSTIYTSFGRVLSRLAAKHQVIAVELQAHGHTPDRNQPLSFAQDADDVAALLHHLHIAKASFLGFSNGGTTTLQIAIRHPELADKIVVASGLYKRDGAYSGLWEAMASPNFDHMPQELKDDYMRCTGSQDGLMTMYDRDVQRMQNFTDIPEDQIKSIHAKTLILSSDMDVVRPEHSVEIFRLIQGSKLLIVPGTHGAFMGEITTVQEGKADYPVMAVIEDFLSEG